jgi:hypothetical protein
VTGSVALRAPPDPRDPLVERVTGIEPA